MAQEHPYDKQFMDKLMAGLRTSRKIRRSFHEERVKAVKDYVGSHYRPESGSSDHMPFNTLWLATTVLIPHLVSQNPAALVSTRVPQLRAYARDWELAISELYEEVKFESTMWDVVLDALFGEGILKTGICSGGEAKVDGLTYQVGRPYVGRVSQNHFAIDPVARSWDEADWMGDRYLVDYDKVVADDSPYQNTGGLQPMGAGSSDNEPKDEEVGGRPQRAVHASMKDKVALWDLYIREDGNVITVPDPLCGEGTTSPLMVQNYRGPATGPYDQLSFARVPDSTYPLAPIHVWRYLNTAINTLARKLIRKSGRAKSILAYEKRASEDAERIRTAPDGAAIQVNQLDKLQEFRLGGVHPHDYAWLIYLLKESGRFMGNIDLIGGMGASAPTLGQSQMLGGASNVRMKWMFHRVNKTAQGATEKLAWYAAYDPMVEIPIMKFVPGTDIVINKVFSAETREGDWLDYNFNVHPYSMQSDSPEAKAQKLIGLFGQVGMPLLELGMQQGVTWSVEGLIKQLARYMGLEEIDEVLQTQQEPQNLVSRQQVGQPGRKAPPPSARPTLPSQGHGNTTEEAVLGNLLSGPTSAVGRPPAEQSPTGV